MTKPMTQDRKYLLTAAVIAVAIAAVFLKYWAYVTNPWTRDGQVRANVIQITSRVTGPIVGLPIRDNQLVRAGDILFELDPRTFEAALEQARAQLDETGDNYDALVEQVESAKAQVEISSHSITQADATINELDAEIDQRKAELARQQDLLPKRATSVRSVERAQASYAVAIENRKAAVASRAQAEAALAQSKAQLAKARAGLGAAGDANPQLRAARAAVKQAELNLEFTKVRAPVDGYVTNLNLRLGSQAIANQPALALVDVNSYWVHGYFREDTVANMRPGDRAIVTLMSYPDAPLEGRVDSLAWGIAQKDGGSGPELLPSVNPTFSWIRLAQRVPVRIHLEDVPEDVQLRVGTTASVLVLTGTADDKKDGVTVPPVPRGLQ